MVGTMNSDTECNCCPPASCVNCTPQCSSGGPHVMIRAERRLKPQLVCSTKNCNIFGSHDVNPMPEYQCRKKSFKIQQKDKNSLGSPIGLVASNVNFKTEGTTSDIIQARYATYLKAFARLYLNEETSWDSLVIDDVMKEGLTLYTNSQKAETNMESPTHIYTPNEVNVLREFELLDFTFRVELMAPFKLNTGAESEEVLTLEDLRTALKRFFRQHKYALLTVGSFYALIWRSSNAYFIFDVCGRRISDFKADKDKGVAMLICLSSLENLCHLIVNLTGLKITEPFTIRVLKVVKVITPNGGIMQQDFCKRTHQYQVVNDDYAYLKCCLHLTLNRNDLVRNRSALPVAVTAIVVSKIDHPATWDMQIVDRIICFGVNFCQTIWANCKAKEIVDVTEFPTYFHMGQFRITTEIMARQYEGTWRCVPGFKRSELANTLKKAFDAGEQKLIMQINYQIYAIWKKHDFIYLLDPYRHRILGKHSDSEVYDQMEKSATVRMFGSFEIFMNVFNNILLDSNRTSKFFIHIVKVKNIQKIQAVKEASSRTVEDTKLDENGEVLSINEHICFEEGEDLCRKALGEISDYEDEDLKSDVVEMELRTSSSEAEVMEEEAVAGEVEEMEGLESSSSGEEGRGHKRKAQSGKSGKGGKGGKGKTNKGKGGKNKGGSGKGKKGQGSKDSEGGGKKRKKEQDKDSDESSDDEGSKTKKGRKDKNKDGNEKTGSRNRKKKPKGGDENETDNENKTKDDKAATDDDKSKQAKDKQDKQDLEKDKEGKDKDGKDKNKTKDAKPKGEDDDKKDKTKKDSSREKTLDQDKDQGKSLNKDIDPNLARDKTDQDKSQAKGLGKDVDTKLTKDKTDQDKGQAKGSGKDVDSKLTRDKTDQDKGQAKGSGKDVDSKLTRDKTDQDKGQAKGSGKDIDSKLTRDKTNQGKGLSKIDNKTDPDLNKDKTYSGQDKDKRKPDKTDKNILSDGSKPTDIANNKTGQDTNTDEDFKYDSDPAEVSDKENVIQNILQNLVNKDADKTLDKDFSGDKSKDTEKNKQDHLTEEMKEQERQLDDLKQKETKAKVDKKSQPKLNNDGNEADDENEDFFKKKQRYCSIPNPNRYPGYLKQPADMAVIGSETGSYESICKLFQAGFKVADRLLTMTPWGNFVIFRCSGKSGLEEKHYFLFDGCTCNFERFRHLDLSVGTAGLICFKHTHNIIEYIRQLRKSRRRYAANQQQYTAEDICRQYSSKSSNLRV